jgi:hypothetical protein
MTTECEHMLAELEEKIGKWKSAAEAAGKPEASEREMADFKIIEEEYLGLQRRVGSTLQIGSTPYAPR